MGDHRMEYRSNEQPKDFDQLPLIIDVAELADILKIGLNNAYQLVRSESVKSLRIGRQYKIPKQALIEYLNI